MKKAGLLLGKSQKKKPSSQHKENSLSSARRGALARSLRSLSPSPARKPKKMWLFLLRWALIFAALYWALKR